MKHHESVQYLNRREALRLILAGTLALPAFAQGGATTGIGSEFNQTAPPYPRKREFPLAQCDHILLEALQESAFRFFWENSHPRTGLIKDRSSANGPDSRTVASIAATGFGLTAYCVVQAW